MDNKKTFAFVLNNSVVRELMNVSATKKKKKHEYKIYIAIQYCVTNSICKLIYKGNKP